MKRYIYILTAALFVAMSLAVTGCSKDDNGDGGGKDGAGKFSFNNKTLYINYQYDWCWPELNYHKSEDILQLGFGLYNSSTFYDIQESVLGDIEFTPFKPADLKKGDKLEIISRDGTRYYPTYTCITFDFEGVDSSKVIAKYGYIYTSGTITFEGFDVANSVVTLKFSNVTLKGNTAEETCVLDGTMKCIYDEPAWLAPTSHILN